MTETKSRYVIPLLIEVDSDERRAESVSGRDQRGKHNISRSNRSWQRLKLYAMKQETTASGLIESLINEFTEDLEIEAGNG